MAIVQEELTLLLSSSELNGAQGKSADGSEFYIQLDNNTALNIPDSALNINVSVEDADVWWTVPNISPEKNNNKLYITGPDVSDVVQNFVITIPKGLYDVSSLSESVQRELENSNAKVDPEPLITLYGDPSTQRVELRLAYDTVSIDFTQSDTPRDILGFNSQIVGPFVTAPDNILGDYVASFNQVNSFLLHCDLVKEGILYNSNYYQIISKIPITVPPGSLINYQPYHPPKSNAQDLAGSRRSVVRVWLTDEKNNPVDTNGEDYNVRLLITYQRPYYFRQDFKAPR